MKNFDLENLDKKTPYNVPDDFFAKMQKNVLDKTINNTPIAKHKEAKIVKLDFKWMTAAAVVLIAGLTAFFNNEESQKDLILAQKNEIIDTAYQDNGSSIAIIKENTSAKESKDQKIEALAKTIATEINSKTKHKPVTLVNNNKTSTTNKVKTNTEVKLNQSLAAFTSAEISEIERSTEQDVYLDLYN